jgi:SAM-dependent MidA family methyltransferase
MSYTAADDFTSITECAPLVAELRARIERDGPITFRDFMETALYHPQHGYYRTQVGATSRGGDYVTSPEIHPVFGALLGRQIGELWESMSRPARFDVVEMGAGRGLLARDIVRWAREREPGFGAALQYTIVEPTRELRSEQERTLSELKSFVSWRDDLPDGIEGVVLSNELLDAFPVHRVRRSGDVLQEVYVAAEGGRFVDRFDAPSTPEIVRYFEALGVQAGDGCYAEVNLEAPRWTTRAADAIKRGYVLTFDYGYEAADLYAPWRRDGTLLCCYRQSASSDPYQRVGLQDITASVDFTTLMRAGEAAGLRTAGYTDQASFLTRMGIAHGVAAAGADSGAKIEEYFARRNVMIDLIDPAKLGRIKVLLQAKGVPDAALRGFHDA